MNIFVVYWHPEPRSFNHAMYETATTTLAAGGHNVRCSNLHAMTFDPVSSRMNFSSIKDANYLKLQREETHATQVSGFSNALAGEMEKLEWCDLMIWQFPLWWFGLPAVLKGWVDRVFAMGRVYGFDHVYETGTCRGKRAMLSTTTGGPEAAFLEGGFNGDIDGILRPIHKGMFQFVGFDVLSPQIVYAPARMSQEQRQTQLETYAHRLRSIAEESVIDIGKY